MPAFLRPQDLSPFYSTQKEIGQRLDLTQSGVSNFLSRAGIRPAVYLGKHRFYDKAEVEWAIREREMSGLKINPPVLQVDVHPEAFYPDHGCRFQPCCLTCALVRCVFDEKRS